MGQWSREEIDQAFQHMLAVIDRYPEERSWDSWVDLLTEDAVYQDDVFEPRVSHDRANLKPRACRSFCQLLSHTHVDLEYGNTVQLRRSIVGQ